MEETRTHERSRGLKRLFAVRLLESRDGGGGIGAPNQRENENFSREPLDEGIFSSKITPLSLTTAGNGSRIRPLFNNQVKTQEWRSITHYKK